MRIDRRRVVGGLVAAVLVVGGVFGVLASSSGATRPAARAAAAQLGSVTALSWGLQTPVGARLVLRPSVSFALSPGALRLLGARNPRLIGLFVARIVTAPARGRRRTLAVLLRRVNGLALGASARRPRGVAFTAAASSGILGRQLQLRGWTLARTQTLAVKRAAARRPLALAFSGRYRVSYTNGRGRRAVTPTRSVSTTLPLALRPQTAEGANLRKLAVAFRALLGRAGQLKTACVTRNSILEQLRSTYSTMVSGDRTGAAALLALYITDAEVMRTSGLLTREQAGVLASGLDRLLRRVGHGQSKRVEHSPRWPALSDCQAGPPRAHTALLAELIHRLVKRVRKTLTQAWFWTNREQKAIYHGTKLLKALWPDDTNEPNVDSLIPDPDPGEPPAGSVLDVLKAQFDNYLSQAECCVATDPARVASAWYSAVNVFLAYRGRFQLGPPKYTQKYQVNLLGLFAQWTNMYLELLREGVVTGPSWGMTPDTTLSIEDMIRAELDATNSSSAISYTNSVYNEGLAAHTAYPDNPERDFASRNPYVREMRLEVLDFRDTWHLEDPVRYPYGDPNFRQTRMIYSDAVGKTDHAFAPPANPSSPLSAVTVWTTRVTVNFHYDQPWLTAIQADNSPQVGARTGATSTGDPHAYDDIAPNDTGSSRGPIVQVDTSWDQKHSTDFPQHLIATVRFYFSDNSTATPGGYFYESNKSSEAYDGEVLAAAKVMGAYPMTKTQDVGDSLVLGWRYADSFSSQWTGSPPGPMRAPNTQACLGVEHVTITAGTHAGSTTGSREDGAALQMRNCSSAEWDQNWQYVDYNDASDPTQNELTVYAGTMCATPKAGGTTVGTPVQSYLCDGSPAQKWTKYPKTGAIFNNESGLCLERAGGAVSNGTPIRLNTCNGSAAQQWSWP